MSKESQKERFIAICDENVKRRGLDKLLAWLDSSGFYVAPASTRFHNNCEGGLLAHSLNVYDALKKLSAQFPQYNLTDESIAIAALFHDVCKVNFYVPYSKNVKDEQTGTWRKEPGYKIEDKVPLGHGEKSVIILQTFIKLTIDEIYAIRWHMGGFDSAVKGGDFGMGKAFEICPLAAMTHMADMMATYLMET